MALDYFVPEPSAVLLLSNQNIPRYIVTPDPEDTRVGTTYLGTPYYDQLTLRYVDNVNGDQSITFQTVLMEVSQAKIIIKTQTPGKKQGSVKEYITDNDYNVRISGAIISPYSNLYPKDEVRQFNKLMGITDALECSSFFLGYFGIDTIVVENFTVSEKLGTRNMVPFEIYAISDQPIEFQLS